MLAMALVESSQHVCYRYRIEAFARELAMWGMGLDTIPLERGGFGRIRQLARTKQASVVILQRRLLPLWELAILRKYAPALVFDFDDAVFQRDSFSSKRPESDWRMLRFWATLYASDAIIAGNAYLAERAGSLIEAERVTVIPTCIDPSRYRPARHERTGGEVRLVWIGQRSTLNSLAFLQEHLAAAAARLPGLQLRVICDALPRLEGIRVVGRPWSSETEAEELADADIGITWLPDDAWSRGKCGLRPLQFMSAGLPVVANPVGMNAEMIVSGQNGILAGSPQEWADAIVRLASDPAQRQRMGGEGRKLVEERYQARHWGQEFAAVLARASWQTKQGRERGRPQPERAFT